MAVPAFDPKELNIVEELPGFFPGAPTTPRYDFPIPMREAVLALYNREPLWQITGTGLEQQILRTSVSPDGHRAATPGERPKKGEISLDMFGVEWEYVEWGPNAVLPGAAMVRPGNPKLKDANEWRDKLVWPDVDSWDWEAAEIEYKENLVPDRSVVCFLACGWFERLISLMDFEGALMAMIDEDQTDAVKAFFAKMSEHWIKVIDKYLEHFPDIDVFSIHDDWGSQRETFFAPAVVADIIVPNMRVVTDHIHSKGRFCDHHSCGFLHKQIPNIIAAGWDSWSPQLDLNDCKELHDLYGDKLIIGAFPAQYDYEKTPEDEQRAIAKAYADTFCDPKKPTMLNFYSGMRLPRPFREELYIRSRENYSR